MNLCSDRKYKIFDTKFEIKMIWFDLFLVIIWTKSKQETIDESVFKGCKDFVCPKQSIGVEKLELEFSFARIHFGSCRKKIAEKLAEKHTNNDF